jgi:hypothetical protein
MSWNQRNDAVGIEVKVADSESIRNCEDAQAELFQKVRNCYFSKTVPEFQV